MDRLDIELYAERLARHAQRAADELADARLREAWWELESAARLSLSPSDAERLEALGLLLAPPTASSIRRGVGERVADLAAIHGLQVIVERQRAESRQGAIGVTATSNPPSVS
ncbi:MAG: hypothetical protein EXQ67_04510 [Thermoleophilia bacterium]|nr:hypothetical protein [Thermoleophilia bacterium]